PELGSGPSRARSQPLCSCSYSKCFRARARARITLAPQLLEGVAAGRQVDRAAGGGGVLLGVVDPQGSVEGGGHVLDGNRALRRGAAGLVALADHLAAADPGAGEGGEAAP